MPSQLNRRAALGLGATAAAGLVLRSTAVASADETQPGQAPPEPTPTTPEQAGKRVGDVYRRETTRAAGSWKLPNRVNEGATRHTTAPGSGAGCPS